MATQAPSAASLPILYNGLEPLNVGQHGTMKLRRRIKVPQIVQTHAIPLTVDEFILAQRNYPIIFSAGESPVPLALMGLNEGVNTYLDEEGQLRDKNIYLPAYLRRYPFLLARLRPESDELSLCVDPTADAIAEDADGDALFDGDQPSEATRNILNFCETFETAGQRTQAFVEELVKMELLMDGEVSIQPDGAEQPFLYRGFKMIDEQKLGELRGDELRKINQNAMLPLIYAHLFSLAQIRELFARQIDQGKGPIPARESVTAEA